MAVKTFYGGDVSADEGVINWPAFNPGAAFVLIKSAGGDGVSTPQYIDSQWGANLSGVRLLGNEMPHLTYYFAGGNDPVKEADWWVSNILNKLQIGEGYVLDAERGNAVEPAWAKAFLDECYAKVGWKGGIYISSSRLTSEDWSAVAAEGYFVWPANWAVAPSGTVDVGAFKTYSFQQYSDNGTFPGISGPVDCDAFFGEAATDILKFGKPAAAATAPQTVELPTPPPVQTPTPSPVVVTVSTTSSPTVATVTPTAPAPVVVVTPTPVTPAPAPAPTPVETAPVTNNVSQGGDMNKAKTLWANVPEGVKRVFHTFWQAAGGVLLQQLLVAHDANSIRAAVIVAGAAALAAVKAVIVSEV